ncbi:hypothetical protein PAMP_004188 [Pampus punctatissimus]
MRGGTIMSHTHSTLCTGQSLSLSAPELSFSERAKFKYIKARQDTQSKRETEMKRDMPHYHQYNRRLTFPLISPLLTFHGLGLEGCRVLAAPKNEEFQPRNIVCFTAL